VCRLAGKPYGNPFGVDVSLAEPLSGAPDLVIAPDTLAFAGVPPPTLRVYPIATHLAEKLHAYTLPRARPNTRVKDLPDLALLATAAPPDAPLDAKRLRAAFAQTFNFRDTHPLPTSLPPPPVAWTAPYERLARDDGLPWATLDDVTKAAQTFLDPLLQGADDAIWDPLRWAWRSIEATS
jgi:hypothetical protein